MGRKQRVRAKRQLGECGFDALAEDAVRVGLWSEVALDALTDSIAGGVNSEEDLAQQWQPALRCVSELQPSERSALVARLPTGKGLNGQARLQSEDMTDGMLSLALGQLAKPATYGRVHELLLDGNPRLTHAGINALSSVMRPRALLSELHILTLRGTRVGDEGCAHLAAAAAAGGCEHLRELVLSEADIGDGIAALADALCEAGCPQLAELECGDNRIGDAGGVAIAKLLGSGRAPRLRQLYLDGHPMALGDAAGLALADAVALATQLERLHLPKRCFGAAVFRAMAAALLCQPCTSQLRVLLLGGCRYSVEPAEHAAANTAIGEALARGAMPRGRFVELEWFASDGACRAALDKVRHETQAARPHIFNMLNQFDDIARSAGLH